MIILSHPEGLGHAQLMFSFPNEEVLTHGTREGLPVVSSRLIDYPLAG